MSTTNLTGTLTDPRQQSLLLAIGQAKTITVTMDAAPAGGVAAWTMRFRVRKLGKSVAFEKTTGSGITVTDAVNGVWTVAVTAAVTALLDPEQYEWSFWRTDTGSENPIAFGFCTPYVTAEVG